MMHIESGNVAAENVAVHSLGGMDRQSTLLHNIRMLSSLMETIENAGYEEFARELAGLRSDLLMVAGMSTNYDSRDPDAVRRDLFENGEKRIRDLIEMAGSIA